MRAVHSLHRPVADDRGAMLIYISLALVALLSLATLVVDYGIFWMGRGQAQNAADAAAHAGAVSLAFENLAAADVATMASTVGNANLVWGSTPAFANGTPTVQRCPNVTTGNPACVQVDVQQTLPSVFGRLVGVIEQHVQATAIAEARPGNTARCLKPWAVPDAWTEVTSDTTFNRYQFPIPSAGGTVLGTPDLYAAPTATDTGTGYRPQRDLGSPLTLHFPACSTPGACRTTATAQQVVGFLMPLNLQITCTGAKTYLEQLEGCVQPCDGPVAIAKLLKAVNPTASVKTDTIDGANALIALDPAATFDAFTKTVHNSCANPAVYTCSQPGLAESPRVVAVAAYDTGDFDDDLRKNAAITAKFTIRPRNFLALFIDHVDAGTGDVFTYLVKKQGDWIAGSPSVSGDSAFTNKVLIVR